MPLFLKLSELDSQTKERIFQFFKYTIYLLLSYNVYAFFMEDHLSAQHLYKGGVSISNLYNAYPQFIDTLAWFALLIMLELETYLIEKESTYNRYKWLIWVTTALCYVAIIFALMGYIEKTALMYGFKVAEHPNACDYLALGIHSQALDLDTYRDLTAENCQEIGAYFVVNSDVGVLAVTDTLSSIIFVAWIDVVNASTWVIIVLVLQLDVYLQSTGKLQSRFFRMNLIFKAVLYSLLLLCAALWGILSDFLDFRDAVLWIIAFFFIELNLFKWHEEEKHLREPTTE